MTKADKEFLLYLVARPRMCIQPVEAASAINYVHGYELGTKNKCDFTKLVRRLIADKYRISYSNDGWPGQIRLLARRRQSTWLITFNKIVLEVILNAQNGSLTDEQQAFLKKGIRGGIIYNIEPTGGPGFENWVEEWQTLYAVKSPWFKPLWTRQEWPIIRAICKLAQTDGLFEREEQRLPSPALLQLKEAYLKVAGEK